MLEFGDIDVNITDRKKRTALHYACAHGQSEMVSLLVWYDCNIEARDRDESTALIKATQRQHEDCVRILLENGADSNAIDAHQNTALHYAIYNNDNAIATKLLAFNADTEIKTKNGYTPLILAVLENKQDMVELLLQASADINALDNCKRSALIHAVRTQSKDMIVLLLQQGANASLVDIYGATAQSYAVFETFQVLSQGPGPSCPELTTEDRHSFDTKDGCRPCSRSAREDNQRVEESADAADKLGRNLEFVKIAIQKQIRVLNATLKQVFAHRPSNSEPIEVEDEPSLSTKGLRFRSQRLHGTLQPSVTPIPGDTMPSCDLHGYRICTGPPVAQSPMLTESSLWVDYPADWPEPIRFSRQPAVYNPTEWREDMESRAVPLEESEEQVTVLPGKEANTETRELQRRGVFKEPGANDPDLPARENAKDELVSLLAPLEENKPQMKEFPVTEAAKFQTEVKLERQGVLECEEKGLEICQDHNLEAAESSESYSTLRFSTKPDVSDPEPTTGKDEYKFDTKDTGLILSTTWWLTTICSPSSRHQDKDGLEKHLLASRASLHQAKQMSPLPSQLQESQLQERAQEPEVVTASDEEDTSGISKSAVGQMLGGKLTEGEKPKGKECVINKPTQKGGEIYEGVNTNVYHKEERPPDISGKAHRTSAPPNLAHSLLDCGDTDVSAALASVALRTSPKQEEGGLGNAFSSPSSSQVVEYSGQSVTKFPLMRNKLDCENNTSELEDSFHKRKEKSSKNIESRKVKGKCPEVRVGEKPEGHEFKSQLQKTMKPKRADWQLDMGHKLKSSDASRLSNTKERSHLSEIKSWGDSTHLVSDVYRKSKGTQDLSLKPLSCKGHGEAPGRTVGTASDALPGGRATRAFKDEELQDRLSDSEFRILEEEILAWEKVHLENESVSENLLNKCEGLISDATDRQGPYLETEQAAADMDSEGTSQLDQKSLDSSENTQLSTRLKELTQICPPQELGLKDADLSETWPQTQNTPTDRTSPIHPLPAKESEQIHPPSLHLKKMSEDRKINKKHDKECAPGHPEVPSVKAHGRESLTGDVTGSIREPNKRGSGLQHTAGDVPENIRPVEEALPDNLRRKTHLKLATKGTETQVNEMEEASRGSEPCLTASGRGSSSPLKLWDTAHSDEGLRELKNSRCELPSRKPGKMENTASEVQREETEIKKIKSWSQHEEVARDKLCNLRFPLKQDEKQENAEFMFQQKKRQLRRGKEQCAESVEQTRHPELRTVITELEALEKDLRQLQGAQDQLTQTVQSSKKIRAILQRLEVRLSKLKLTLKEQSAKIEQIQNHLRHKGLPWLTHVSLGDETKKLILQTQSLECTLEKQMNKNEELLTELMRFKKLFEETKKKLNKHEGGALGGPGDLRASQYDMHVPVNMLRHEFHSLKESWETTYSKYLHMVVKLQFIEQELIAIKTEQKKCGHLLNNQKNLEKEVLRLKRWLRESETQAREQTNMENLRDANGAAMISQMDLRIKDMESQLATSGTQQHLHGGGMLRHKHHHAEEGSPAQPVSAELREQAKQSPGD
ncbi:Ankyrin repeat domain 36 [Apodemus speciosus]|uniref:Ankyrin repeat domain 36 n=1 Tax=Apodemus speciosus TaxID=105296 RepID=A0ABQ0F921_APOSI